jgi:hypothetical protein
MIINARIRLAVAPWQMTTNIAANTAKMQAI